MTEKEIILALIQILPIIIIWVRIESRLARLEGRFDMFLTITTRALTAVEKRHGTNKEGE